MVIMIQWQVIYKIINEQLYQSLKPNKSSPLIKFTQLIILLICVVLRSHLRTLTNTFPC